jgi:hypothetical protein
MRRLNKISTKFVTELIDIITPQRVDHGIDSKKTDSTNTSHENELSLFMEDDVLSLCLVLDFVETDLD